MANIRIESSKRRLFDKINEGRKYLEKEHYDYNELIRLKNQLEKKKLQFEKDLGDYTNTEEKDEDMIFEYEEVKVDEEEVCDDLLHFIDVIKQQEEKRRKERPSRHGCISDASLRRLMQRLRDISKRADLQISETSPVRCIKDVSSETSLSWI